MTSGSDKKRQQELERQQAADRANFEASLTRASEPTPLQARWEKDALDFLDAESGKSGPVDVTKLPGMAANVDLYNRARTGQEGERQGLGALRLGLNAADPNLTAKLAAQDKARREQDAGGQLENAYRARSAEVHGTVLPTAALNQSRTMGIASLRGGQAGQSQGLWANFRGAPSIWQRFLDNAARGAGQGAAMAAGAP